MLPRFGSAAILALLLLGCGSDGPRMHPVSGQVAYDGEPVESGEIVFESTTPGIAVDGGRIKQGLYSLKVKEGSHTVRINAGKMFALPPGKKNFMGETQEMRQFIPERYNVKSELTRDVRGPSTMDFELKSK